eukprot:5789724-Pyramimonas_sp.AAC.1
MGRVFDGWKPPPPQYRCSLPAASQPVSQSASQSVSRPRSTGAACLQLVSQSASQPISRPRSYNSVTSRKK